MNGRAVAKAKQKLTFPDRKISETFLDFAEPLLDPLGPWATLDQKETSLQLAFTVWNAVVYKDAVDDSRFIESIGNLTANDPVSAALVDEMVHRKRTLFGDDHRLVGEFKLSCQAGEWKLRAEARAPRPSS